MLELLTQEARDIIEYTKNEAELKKNEKHRFSHVCLLSGLPFSSIMFRISSGLESTGNIAGG
jgi:hypothetical protein